MKTIYKTRGAALEYCEYAIDIYTGCPHECKYCYAKSSAEKKSKNFTKISVREGILDATKDFLKSNPDYYGKTIFLGFSSDPFPNGYDNSATIDMIKLLKSFGCHIMFCTKGKISSDVIELLDSKDSVGITITCGDNIAAKYEPNSIKPTERLKALEKFYKKGIETWISIEPVLEPNFIYSMLESDNMKFVTRVKLGKLNHMNISDLTGNSNDYIDWIEYRNTVIDICKKRNIEYIVKDALLNYNNK